MQQVLGVLRQLLRKLDIKGDEDVALLARLLRQGQSVTWTPASIIIRFYYARMCIGTWYSLDCGGSDDLVGKVEGDLVTGEGRDVHQHSAQSLETLSWNMNCYNWLWTPSHWLPSSLTVC